MQVSRNARKWSPVIMDWWTGWDGMVGVWELIICDVEVIIHDTNVITEIWIWSSVICMSDQRGYWFRHLLNGNDHWWCDLSEYGNDHWWSRIQHWRSRISIVILKKPLVIRNWSLVNGIWVLTMWEMVVGYLVIMVTRNYNRWPGNDQWLSGIVWWLDSFEKKRPNHSYWVCGSGQPCVFNCCLAAFASHLSYHIIPNPSKNYSYS
jgi:hypothetical protein